MELIHLKDYYEPLNLRIGLFLVILLFVFKSVGFLIRRKLFSHLSSPFIVLDWLIGFGLFIFLWFCLGFWIIPSRSHVIASLIFFGIIPVNFFMREVFITKNFFRLLSNFLRENFIPFLIMSPFFPVAYIRASLPPYYSDEMAYHFISPAQLNRLKTWSFASGVYDMIPRLLDTFFLLGFSLTKTQVIGRSVHFLILITSLLFVFRILKTEFGKVSAFIFLFAFWSLPQDIVFCSTLGFVDVAGYSFILIATVAGIFFLRSPSQDLLVYSFLFWGMSLGTKYAALTFFISFLVVSIIWVRVFWREYFHLFSRKTFFKISFVFCVFGGFWYLKNLFLTGNPIYPFLFPCYRWGDQCRTGSTFFGNWTTPIKFENFGRIIKDLLIHPKIYLNLFYFGLLGLLEKPSKKTSLFLLVLISILLEFLILKPFSGFMVRYQQHQQFVFIFMMAGLTGVSLSVFQNSRARFVLIVVIISTLFPHYKTHLIQDYERLQDQEISYALGKIDIFDFIQYRMPKNFNFIKWCDYPPEGRLFKFVRYDPDLIWYDDAAYSHQFLTNCIFDGQTVPTDRDLSWKELTALLTHQKLDTNLFTINACVRPEQVKKKFSYEDAFSLRLRKINNFLVCHSKPILPGFIYHIDYH